MSKRKSFIELQNKPENKAVRKFVERTKLVDYAPLKAHPDETDFLNQSAESQTDGANGKLQNNRSAHEPTALKNSENGFQSVENNPGKATNVNAADAETFVGKNALRSNQDGNTAVSKKATAQKTALAQTDRLRIFQASTPVTRTVTKFQKAAIVVRNDHGKQLVELLWRDQMNEKTRDIWDYLVQKFVQAEELNTNEVLIRKRDILEGSGVKSDRTFISAIYTLEDMGLIEVRRLSGNKEGNVYVLTGEGREELDGYQK